MNVGTVQLGRPITQFCHWWFRELRACVPGLGARRLMKHPRALIVQMLTDQVRLFHLNKGVRAEIGEVTFDNPNSSSTAKQVARLLQAARVRRADVVLVLPTENVLQRRISLPLAAQENLREVLAFEMERYTAFNAEDVYYSYRLADTNHAEKRIAVDLAVVPRAIADKSIELVKGWGLAPDTVTVTGHDLAIDDAVNFLSKPAASKSERSVRRLIAALTLISVSLASSAIYLSVLEQERRLAAYQEAVEQGRATSLQVDALRQRLSQLLERSRYVAHRKQAQPLLAEVLEETTKLLPDNTWVVQFRLQHGQIMLSGYSAAASALIEALEASPLLSQVTFVSPVTLDPKQGIERFNLTAQIESEMMP